MQRPDWDSYFMTIAHVVRQRSNCCRRHVGAVIVRDRIIISTGYNGTPLGIRNCYEGGCPRCNSEVPPGQGYDTCICVHAEENAIVFAARNGTATNGSTLYTTLRPCFGCLKRSIQAGIREIVFEEDDCYGAELEEVYERLIREAGLIFRRVALKGPGGEKEGEADRL